MAAWRTRGRPRVCCALVSCPQQLGAALAGAGLVVILAAPALAHADIVSSTPVAGAILDTPPVAVELTFSEVLAARKSSFRLVGPEGEIGTGSPTRAEGKVMRLEGLALVPGEYTVKWTAASVDGHVERGTFRFTVSEPAASAAPTPAPTDAAPTAPTAPTDAPATDAPPTGEPATNPPAAASPAAASPAADPADPAPTAGSGMDVVLPIVAALLMVGVAGGWLLRRGWVA
jgi:hypothetical protein